MFVSCKDYDDDIKKNSDAISSLQQTLNNLQSALDQAKSDAATAHATFATKVELGQVDTAVKALQEEIKALATKTALEDAIAKVNEAIGKNATKEELAELSSMVAAINTDLDAIGEWQKTTDDAIKTANENIGKQEEALAALALVVAAGDQKNADAIAALQTALAKAIKDGDKANSDAIADLKTALEKSIAEGDNTNAAAIAALEEVVGTKADAKALTDAVKKLEDAIATKANQSALDALSKLVDAKATIASVDELEAALTEKIADAVTELEKVKETMATASDINDIKDAMKKADEAIKKNLDAINLLQVFIAKRLTSLVFQPDLYLDGIEAVEASAINDTILALADEKNRGKVTELWGVKGAAHVVVPDSALTTWYKGVPTGNAGPAYIEHGWKINGTATDTPWEKNAVQYYTYYPLATAKYHINPSTANLDGAQLSFYANYPEVKWNYKGDTRGANDGIATPVPATIEKTSDMVEDGILSVPFKVDRTLLNAVRYKTDNRGYVQAGNNPSDDEIRATLTGHEALIALQATVKDEAGNDTTVTSDYALLYPTDYDIVALGGKWLHKSGEKHYIGYDHLWTKLIAKKGDNPTFAGADPKKADIASGFMLYEEGTMKVNGQDVPYYSPIDAFKEGDAFVLDVEFDKSVDLKEQVFTHVRKGYSAPNGIVSWDKYCTEADNKLIADLGLHYEFEAIHYVSGSNRTDEFEHIEVIDGVAYPRSVTEDGKMIAGQTATNEIVGRMPIVRVTLEDDKHNVLAVGYILLHIVNTKITNNHVTIDLPVSYMNCTAPAAITWSQVEALILREVGMDKRTFETLYTLETIGHTADYDGRFFSMQAYGNEREYPGHYGDKIKYGEGAGYVNKTAVQYIDVDGQGSWTSVFDINKAIKTSSAWTGVTGTDAERLAKRLAMLTYPLGSVYETYNGERQQTSVLEWNVGSQVNPLVAYTYNDNYSFGNTTEGAGQSQKVSIEQAMIASGASVASKGVSTNAIEVTVAYKQYKAGSTTEMTDQNAIYVTLRIPAGNLKFAYAEAAGKDLANWYYDDGYQNVLNNESEAAEIHINVPSPDLQGTGATITRGTASYKGLHDIDFGKVIDQTFMNSLVKMGGFDKDNFSRFANVDFSYHLVAPKKGESSTDLNASKKKQEGEDDTFGPETTDAWEVEGVTGNIYLLHVVRNYGNDKNVDVIEIASYIDAEDGKVKVIGNATEKQVVKLVRNITGAVTNRENSDTKGTKIALMPNRYAQDIVNKIGRYDLFKDADGNAKDNNTTYLDNEGKTFTAFIEIVSGNPCYKLMMPNSYFKARFLRPINVMPGTDNWTDATNVVQKTPVWKLTDIKDWRTWTLGTSMSANNVDAKYYGIADSTYKHYWVDMDEIRTDHGKAVNDRQILYSVDAIKALEKRNAHASLMNEYLYLSVDEKDGSQGILTLNYKNNGANVGTFHIYVPVYVAYSFGEFDYNGTYGQYGNVTNNAIVSVSKNANRFNYAEADGALYTPFVGNRAGLTPNSMDIATLTNVKVPLFTQKVWAVITVKQTTDSQTQTQPAGARKH